MTNTVKLILSGVMSSAIVNLDFKKVNGKWKVTIQEAFNKSFTVA